MLFSELKKYIPGLAPILISWFFVKVVRPKLDSTISPEPPQLRDPSAVAGGAALGGSLTGITFGIVIVIGLAVLLFVACSVVARHRGKAKCLSVAAVVFLIVVSVGLLVILKGDESLVQSIGLHIFCSTIDQFAEPSGLSLSVLEDWKRWVKVLSILSFSSLIVAACTLAPGRLQVAAADIAERIRFLKYYLVAASVFFASGVAFLSSWVLWPRGFYAANEVKEAMAYAGVAYGWILFFTSFWILSVVGVFAPLALWLKIAGERLACVNLGACDPSYRREWLQKRGLALSLTESLLRVATILSPFAVPLLSSVVSFGLPR